MKCLAVLRSDGVSWRKHRAWFVPTVGAERVFVKFLALAWLWKKIKCLDYSSCSSLFWRFPR